MAGTRDERAGKRYKKGPAERMHEGRMGGGEAKEEASEPNDSPAEEKGEDIHGRHRGERDGMLKRHSMEAKDLQRQHLEAHRKMFSRHDSEHTEMNSRHRDELLGDHGGEGAAGGSREAA